MFGGDACLGVENVGYQVLSQQGNSICDSFGGTGSADNCLFNIYNSTDNSSAPIEIAFNLSVPETYQALAKGCNPARDPLNPAFNSLETSIYNYIPAKVDDYLDTSNGSEVEILPPLKDTLRRFSKAVANTTVDFVGNLHDRVIGCESLHGIYGAAKDSFCCDMLSAVYWMVASWYLIAWSMLCCGCGAAVMGRKRFPHKLFGAAYLRDMRALQEGDKAANDEMDQWDGDQGQGISPIELDKVQGSAGFEAPDVQFDGPEVASGFEGHGSGPMALGGSDLGPQSGFSVGTPFSQPEMKEISPEPQFVIEKADDQAMGGDQPPFDLGGDGVDQQAFGDQGDTGGEIEI
jgi:hypothetical protein